MRRARHAGRRSAARRLSSHTTASPAKSVTWCASPSARGVARGDVEQRRADQAHHQRGDDRQQARDARRLPRREEEADAERDVERAEVPRGVHRQPGVGPEDQRRDRHRDLRQPRWPTQDPAQRELRVGVGRRRGGRVRSAPMAARMPGREVGDRGRGREPHAAVQALGVGGEAAAVGAARRGGRRAVGVVARPGSSPSRRAEIAWRMLSAGHTG